MKEIRCCGLNAYVRYVIMTKTNEVIALDYFARSRQGVRSIAANFMSEYSIRMSSNGCRYDLSCIYNASYMATTAPVRNGYAVATEGLIYAEEVGETFLITSQTSLYRDFYNHLMNRYDLPLLYEWSEVLYSNLLSEGKIVINENACITGNDEKIEIQGIGKSSEIMLIDFRYLTEDMLEDVVSTLLKEKQLSFTEYPQRPLTFNNLDEYFNNHGGDIVRNLRDKATPVIETDGTYSSSVTISKRLFAAQADCVNGIISSLKSGKYCIVNEGMGCGKTLQGAVAVDGYMTQKYLTAHPDKTLSDVYQDPDCIKYRTIVMCPGHLVTKWVEEIEEQIPYAKAVALTEFSQLVEILKHGPKREGRIFYVMSRDFGKLSYTEIPVPVKLKYREIKRMVCTDCGMPWSGSGQKECSCGSRKHKLISFDTGWWDRGLVCPECGELVMPYSNNPITRSEDDPTYPLTPGDFRSHSGRNDRCYYCGCRLWQPYVSNIGGQKESPWYRVKRYKNAARKGMDSVWVLKGQEEDLIIKNKTPGCTSVDDLVEIERPIRVRRYSPARFIQKKLHSFFDMAVLDEWHEYRGGGTAQGMAAGALISVAKKVLVLTGTLSGGTAEDLFYNLFRLDPARMLRNGFCYGMASSFSHIYGCVENKYECNRNETGGEDEIYNVSSRGKKIASERVRPGISPLLFTDFLLDRTVFLDLKDMSNQLPPLKEYIVGVDLEDDIQTSYRKALDAYQSLYMDEKRAVLASKLQFALSYTDKPYGRLPVLSTVTGEVAVNPDNLDKYKSTLTNKERELIRIVKSEIEQGRSIFVYATFTGTEEMNISERLKTVIERNVDGLQGRVDILRSTSTSTTKRMDWIKERAKEGVRVIITNPKLCETGLDFIFTYNGVTYNYNTIIMYQTGYSLFTLWQAASRHYRLSQTEECRTYYLYTRDTIQLDVLKLMAQKRNAVSVLQGGGFSSEGLAGMSKGVDVANALAYALQNGVADEHEVEAMFNNESSDTSEQYDKNFVSMHLFKELMGHDPEHKMNKETTPIASLDMFDMFDILSLKDDNSDVMQQDEVEVIDDNRPSSPEAEVKTLKDTENIGKVELKVATKSRDKRCLDGQLSFFDL